MSSFALCTTLSNRDLALAVVLARRFRDGHAAPRDAQIFACVADRPDPEIAYSELPFEVVFSDQLGIPDFESMAFACDRDRHVAAVVPYFLDHLRERGQGDGEALDRLLWVEPDTWIVGPLGRWDQVLDQALRQNDVVLFARINEPTTDPVSFDDVLLRRHGAFDSGALGLRFGPKTGELLDRWKQRSSRLATASIEGGGSGGSTMDREFIEWLPAFVESVHVIRDPDFAVLGHRRETSEPVVERQDSGWSLDGNPLSWVRWTGLDRQTLRWQGEAAHRFRRAEPGPLKGLVDAYRREVLTAAGEHDLGSDPAPVRSRYGYDQFEPIGIAIPPGARLAYRRIDPHGKRWPNPFDSMVADSFLSYLLAPIETDRGRLNRAALALWEASPHLIAEYPEVCGDDLADFVEFLQGEAEEASSLSIDPVFLEGLATGPSDGREPPSVLAFGGALRPYEAAITTGAQTLLDSVDLAAPGGVSEWLNEPIAGAAAAKPIITRLALLLHATRLDLQADYPRPLAEDQAEYGYWFANFAETDLGVAPELVRPVRESLPLKSRVGSALRDRKQGKQDQPSARNNTAAANSTDRSAEKIAADPASLDQASLDQLTLDSCPTLGVNLIGYPDSDSGLGQIARGSHAALRAARISTTIAPLDRSPDVMMRGGRVHLPEGCPHPITLLHATADETRRELAKLPSTVAAGSFRIGYWFWEMAFFPILFADRYSWLDEIWAPSRFCQRAFEPLSTVPVRYVPPCAPRPEPEQEAEAARERFGLEPGRFYFLFAFDVWSVPERKNPQAAIEAIRWLSEGIDQPVGLILKVTRSRLAPEALARLRQQAEGLPVIFHVGEIDRGAMDTLVEASDACLSLHRSEGLGLLPIESLFLGKPVIATDYGGVTDFLDESTGFPVDHSLRRLDRDHPPYPQGAVWAEPRLDVAVEAMRRCVQEPDEARRRTEAGQARVEELYGTEAAAKRFADELSRIEARLGSSRR